MVRRAAVALFLLLLPLAGCGGGGDARLELSLALPEGWEERLDMGALAAPGGTPYVGTIRVRVEREGSAAVEREAPFSSRKLDLSGLAAGDGYSVSVAGITRGEVILAAEAAGLTLGGSASPLPLELREVNGFSAVGSLIYPRQWHSAELFSDKVFIVGGNKTTKTIETISCSSGISANIYSVELSSPANSVSLHYFAGGNVLAVNIGGPTEGFGTIDLINLETHVSILSTSKNGRKGYFFGGAGETVFLAGGYENIVQWKSDVVRIDVAGGGKTPAIYMTSPSHRNQVERAKIGVVDLFIGGTVGPAFSSSITCFNFSAEINAGEYQLLMPREGSASENISSEGILIFGGANSGGVFSGVEYFSLPGPEQYLADPMVMPRKWHTATLLDSGKVLLVGGASAEAGRTAELYDPSTGESRLLPWRMRVPRCGHTATRLPDGRVLLVGGNPVDRTIEVYNPPAEW